MNTYKIGNKVVGIIRSYSGNDIGEIQIQYSNQPYTIIQGANVSLSFSDIDSVQKARFTQLAYNDSKLNKVDISDVALNDKILNLIFSKSEVKLMSKVENYESNDGILYLNPPTDTIYQVFIFDTNQELKYAAGTLTDMNVNIGAAGNFLVCYQYEASKAYSFDKPENQYYTLDLIVTGNADDNTRPMNIHIEKCGLKIDKNMYFNQHSNSVDLTFTIIDTEANYITLG